MTDLSSQERGIGSAQNPSPNHLAALAREEREHRKAEAARMLLNSSPPDPGSDLRALLNLLADPVAVRKRLADITAATAKNNEAAASAQHQAANLKQAEQGFAARKKAVDDEIERDRSEHNARLAAERAEIESERKAVAKLKAQAETDAAKAKAAAAEAARRLRAMEGAA